MADPNEAWRLFEEVDFKEADISPLLRFGGFPEPYLKQNSSFHSRWIRTRRARITHEEIRDLTRIEDLDRVEYLVQLLNPRIGSPLSVNSLRGDLQVAFETARNLLSTLVRVYYVFGLRPYSERIQRALRRERKLYFWDWSEVRNEAQRFENFVISHLDKACHLWTDFGLGEFTLWYVRDKEKREVDAFVTRNGEPWLIAEIKLTETALSPTLVKFAEHLSCPRVLEIVQTPGVRLRLKKGTRVYHVSSAGRFLPCLP